MMRMCSAVLMVLVFSGVMAGESVKISDNAATKLQKLPVATPGGFGSETLSKQTANYSFVIPAPGLDPTTLTADTAVAVRVTSGSGSSEYTLNFKLGDDPKYVPGAKGAKVTVLAQPSFGNITKLNTFRVMQVKFGKDAITLTVQEKYLSLVSLQYINFGSIPNGVRYPEGNSEHTKLLNVSASVGSFTSTYNNIGYLIKAKNKPVKGSSFWTGSASGSFSLSR